MLENIALYQNKEYNNKYSYRCIPTIRGKEYCLEISHYSANRLTELMQERNIKANVTFYMYSVALHYWTEHKDHN